MQNEEPSFFTESRKQIEQYIQDRLLLIKLQVAQETARFVGLFFTGLLLSVFGFCVLQFLGMMGGYWFASLTDSLYIGFGIIAAIYLVLFLLIVKFRKILIETRVGNIVVRRFFEKEKEVKNETIN